jgi:hypothetical protein
MLVNYIRREQVLVNYIVEQMLVNYIWREQVLVNYIELSKCWFFTYGVSRCWLIT